MPQLALAAQAFTTAGTAASISAATAAVAKATLMTTLKSVAMNVLTNVAISAAMSALQPQVGAAGRTFEWTLDPDGPIPFAAGRIGVPGSAVYRKTFGPDLMYYGIPSVLSGAGPIDGFEGVQADDEAVTFNASGMAITSQYANELWYRNRLGTQPDTALVSPTGLKNGASLPGWTSAHKLSGKACYLLVMGENSKGTAYPTGEVKPIITFRGLKGWDPRLDSTYPGGAGACRLNDPSTWVYITNPILWALKWALGLWEGPTGKGAPQVDYQVGGIGAKLSGIDVPAFVAAANVADANAWTVGAYPTTDDDKSQVLDAFLQAGGAIYAQRAGKISCIQRASIRASIVTISAADTAGPLEIDTAASRIDRINTIRPRFWSEAHRWQLTAIDEVTAAAYQAEDGAKRTRGIDYPYVTVAKQTAQLAALQIANTREGIAGVIPLKPHLQRIRPGDAFTITEPGFVLNGVKCLCLNTDYDPATGVVRVSFVSETDGKYAFAMGQDPTPPAPPVLTPVDPTYVTPPQIGDWTIVVRPPSPGGGQLPGFDLSGVVSNDTATAIIVEHGPSAAGPWTQAYQGPPTVTNIPVDGLQPGATYYVAIQYQRNQNYSARQVYGPYTAPLLDPSPTAPTITALNADLAALESLQASETVIREQADNQLRAVPSGGVMNTNPAFAAWPGALPDGWTRHGAVANSTITKVAGVNGSLNALRQASNGAAECGIRCDVTPAAGGEYVVIEADFTLVAGSLVGAGILGQTLNSGGSSAGNTFSQPFATAKDASGTVRGAGVAGQTYRYRLLANLKAPTVATYRIYGMTRYSPGAWGPADGAATLDWHRLAIRPATPEEIASGTVIPALQASVSQNSLAIIDLETGQALAKFELVAAASGGKPARFKLVSSSLGSAIALDAPFIYFGDNTVFDDATDTFQTTVDGVTYIQANGAGFGVGGTLRLWMGPAGIALSAMSKANATFFLSSDAPGVGGTSLRTNAIRQATVTGRALTAGANNLMPVEFAYVVNGSNFVITLDLSHSGSGSYIATGKVISANLDGSDEVELYSGGGVSAGSTQNRQIDMLIVPNTRNGPRKVFHRLTMTSGPINIAAGKLTVFHLG